MVINIEGNSNADLKADATVNYPNVGDFKGLDVDLTLRGKTGAAGQSLGGVVKISFEGEDSPFKGMATISLDVTEDAAGVGDVVRYFEANISYMVDDTLSIGLSGNHDLEESFEVLGNVTKAYKDFAVTLGVGVESLPNDNGDMEEVLVGKLQLVIPASAKP